MIDGLHAACGLAIFAAALCLQNSSAQADSSTTDAVPNPAPTKLVWKAVRPQRTDVPAATAAKETKDAAVQAARYDVDVFGDDPAPAPTKQIKLTAGQSGVKDSGIKLTGGESSTPSADAFVDDLPSVKAPRVAQRASDSVELNAPATRDVPPTWQIESSPVRSEPAELTPASPIHISGSHHTAQSFQQSPPTTPAPTTEPPSDLTPGGDLGATARPRMPEQDCHEEYDRVKAYTLNKLNISIVPPKDVRPDSPNLPYECSLTTDPFVPRSWQTTTFTWKASALCHKPLYFEEVAAERYGHSRGPYGCEYLTSFCHFFGNLALLPYWVGVDTPCECIYDLGYYRVGDCAPYEFDAFPLSVRVP